MGEQFLALFDKSIGKFVSKVTTDQESDLPIKVVPGANPYLLVLKTLTSMKISGYYIFKNPDPNFILNELDIGIISSKSFKKYIDLFNDKFTMLIKDSDSNQISKLFLVMNDGRTSQIPLSDYVRSQMPQPINIERPKIFELDLN